MTRVARAFGCLPREIMAEPYAATLWSFYQLLDQDRLDGFRTRAEAHHLAALVAMAFHKPEALDDEYRKLLDEAGMLGTVEDAMDKTRDVIRAMQQVDAGALTTEAL